MYDENNGWAFKAIDYIVFPIGLMRLQNTDSLLVTLGRNDKSGWLLELNLTGLVETLEPVRSKVLENRHVGAEKRKRKRRKI